MNRFVLRNSPAVIFVDFAEGLPAVIQEASILGALITDL